MQLNSIKNSSDLFTGNKRISHLSGNKRISHLSGKNIETRRQRSSGIKKLLTESHNPPFLRVSIQHTGNSHDPNALSGQILYSIEDADGNAIEIDVKKLQENLYNEEETEKDFVYKDKEKIITVKGETIKKFRQENNFYGPIKVTPEFSTICENGFINEVYTIRLAAVDICVTRKEDRSVNEQELNMLLHQTPGIIPSCWTPSSLIPETDYTLFSKEGKSFRVWNKVLAFFKEHTRLKRGLTLKAVDEIFCTSENKPGLMPVTDLYIGEKRRNLSHSLAVRKARCLQKRKMNLDSSNTKTSRENNHQHCYDTGYINWAQRGNACFSEIKRIGIEFIDEVFVEQNAEDDLTDLSNSFSCSAENCFELLPTEIQVIESVYLYGSQENGEEMWDFLSTSVKSNSSLITFQYNMENERWIEIKRNFNIYQINGESTSDIISKVVMKSVGGTYSFTYYLRCLGNLVKTGKLSSKSNISNLLKCFGRDRYICVGFDKNRFLYQVDENEALRKCLKENATLQMTPFEKMCAKSCKGIVRDSVNVGNYQFHRNDKTIYGPLLVCKSCEILYNKLDELFDPTLTTCKKKLDLFKPRTEQRFGPVESHKLSKSIRMLCTETPFEFISDARKEMESFRQFDQERRANHKAFDIDTDISEDERPSFNVTEKEFEGLLFIEHSRKSKKLDKSCKKCGFVAKSMLALFSHMSNHIETTAGLPKNETFKQVEKRLHPDEVFVCSICQATSFTSEDFIDHMNSHRSSKPFVCSFCDQRFQTIDAYKKHMKQAHHFRTLKEINFMCKGCHNYYYTSDLLLIHSLNSEHIEISSVKCCICSFTFASVSEFQDHILTHTYEEREYHNLAICAECKTFFFSSFELEMHSKEKHSNKFINKDGTSENITNSTDFKAPKSVTCGKCLKIFETHIELMKHLEICDTNDVTTEEHATQGGSYIFSCDLCGMKFTSEYFHSAHMDLHTTNNRQAFQCDSLTFVYPKRTVNVDQLTRDETLKHSDKDQQLLHQQQQQQLSSFNPMFTNEQPFTDSHISGIEIQSQVPSGDTSWTQHPQPTAVDTSQASVYSLLHL